MMFSAKNKGNKNSLKHVEAVVIVVHLQGNIRNADTSMIHLTADEPGS